MDTDGRRAPRPVAVSRFDEAAQPIRYLSFDDILVRCPRCDGRARARRGTVGCGACGLSRRVSPEEVPGLPVHVNGRCGDCGRQLRRTATQTGSRAGHLLRCPCGWSKRVTTGIHRYGLLRDGRDPYTGLPLWLRESFRGRILWAANPDHLTFLENYVAARLRETGPGNATLASRIPAWVKSAKHRDDILRLLGRMRRGLED